MNLEVSVNEALRACGQLVAVQGDEQARFYASIQPAGWNTQMRTEGTYTRFGRTDPRRFFYYGPLTGGGVHVCAGAVIKTGQKLYEILICHDFEYGGAGLFRWAEARLIEGGMEDGCTDGV